MKIDEIFIFILNWSEFLFALVLTSGDVVTIAIQVANDVSDSSIGFNSEENAATVLWQGGEQVLERAGKGTIARQILSLVATRLETGN